MLPRRPKRRGLLQARQFTETFSSVILWERDLQYQVRFTGPTGAIAIEAALALSRRFTGRRNVISFKPAYDGNFEQSAASGNRFCRGAEGLPLSGVEVMPYDRFLGSTVDTADHLRNQIIDGSSGIDHPAAIFIETTRRKPA